MNIVVLSGRIAHDLELRTAENGSNYVVFSLAVPKPLNADKRAEFKANNRSTADYIRCICFHKLADILFENTKKGGRIQVMGSIQSGSAVDEEGEIRYITNILVQKVDIVDWKNDKKKNQTLPEEEVYEESFAEEFPFN